MPLKTKKISEYGFSMCTSCQYRFFNCIVVHMLDTSIPGDGIGSIHMSHDSSFYPHAKCVAYVDGLRGRRNVVESLFLDKVTLYNKNK
jgi:hypothetical protein